MQQLARVGHTITRRAQITVMQACWQIGEDGTVGASAMLLRSYQGGSRSPSASRILRRFRFSVRSSDLPCHYNNDAKICNVCYFENGSSAD